MTPRSASWAPTRQNSSRVTPASTARSRHGSSRISSAVNSRLSGSSTRHSSGDSSTSWVLITSPSSSALLPGSIIFRRTCPTPSANRHLAGIIRNPSAPTRRPRNSQCACSRVTLRHFERGPEPIGRSRCLGVRRPDDHMTRKGVVADHRLERRIQPVRRDAAASAPGARLVAMSVCRIRRIVPAASMARSRSRTCPTGTPDRSAISVNGSRRKQAMRSSETVRIRALTESVISAGTQLGGVSSTAKGNG